MANKTATLKNQAGDNIYPNIVGDNRNAAIKDSATIKHTLAENKISLDLDETIKEKINAALQKPTGLTKTKLVGVGAQGQENIEIGDNLTLANGKLSSSATGGGNTLYEYTLYFMDKANLGIKRQGKFYSSVDIGKQNKVRTSEQIAEQLLPESSGYELVLDVFGVAKIDASYYSLIQMDFGTNHISLYYLDPAQGMVKHSHDFLYDTTNTWNVIRNIASPRQK